MLRKPIHLGHFGKEKSPRGHGRRRDGWKEGAKKCVHSAHILSQAAPCQGTNFGSLANAKMLAPTPIDSKPFSNRHCYFLTGIFGRFKSNSTSKSKSKLISQVCHVKGHNILRSVYLWIKWSVKSRAFLLGCDTSLPQPSGASHRLFYPEIPPPQYG